MKTAKLLAGIVVIAGMLALSSAATAGNLQPPAAPGSTMKTLDEVEPRISISQTDIPLNISESGSYYLTEDVNSTGIAVIVNVNDVTIDLMGYQLTGLDGNYAIYINGRSNVEIRNGTVRNFNWHGITTASNGNSRAISIINIRSMDNGESGIYLGGNGHLVKDCVVSGNQSSSYGAIRLGWGSSDGTGCTVTGNLVFDNNFRGIESAREGCTITNNTVHNNGSDGIYASSSTITGNTVYNNGGYGIRTTGTGNTLINNTANNNSGRGISAGYGSTVTGNTAYQNSGYGIYVGSGSTVTGNTAYQNTDHGISAGSGCTVTGNTAYSNQSNGFYVGYGCTVIGNAANNNQNYGIYLAGNSFVDQNTAYNNNLSGGGYLNMNLPASCTFGTNHAPL